MNQRGSKGAGKTASRHAPLVPDARLTGAQRDKALVAAMGEIEKNYGAGSIMRLGDDIPLREIRGISTGSISLDLALGGKGLPRGRVVEVYGPESSGKTTLALHVAAEAQ